MTFLSIIQNIALCFGIYFIIILFPWVFAIFSQKHSEIDNLNTPLKSKTRKKTYSYNIDISSEIYAPENYHSLQNLRIDDTGLIIENHIFSKNEDQPHLENSEHSNKSLEELNAILDENPSHFEALLFSGVHLSSLSKYSLAQKNFEKAYQLNSSSTEINYRLARCYYQLGFLENTIPLYSFLLNNNPEKYLYLKRHFQMYSNI